MFRIRIFWALAIVVTSANAGCGQSREAFSEPQSLLLFSGDSGDLLIVSPTGNVLVPHPSDSIVDGSLPLPALSRGGDQIAASFRLPDDPGSAICHPSWPTRGPYKQPIFKSMMGVYSLREKAWKFYGDFCFVGSAAFSPDGKKVAFEADVRPDDPRFSSPRSLMILDLETGRFTPVPETAAVRGNSQISWSPDAKYLAVAMTNGEKSPVVIVRIEIESRNQRVIAEGTDPAWSPNGDWIAYHADWNRECVLINPDGTGAKTVLDLRRRSGGWILYDTATWSPDGRKLLLNEERVEGFDFDITMLDLTTGKTTRKSRKGRVVLGWAAKSGD